MPSYLVHVMEGRARLRHAALRDPETCASAQNLLQKEKDVREVHPGKGSLLLLLTEQADLAAICERLEEKLPQLVSPLPLASAIQTGRAGQRSGLTATLGKMLPGCNGISPRRLETRTMFGVAGLCVLSGLIGGKGAHVLSGGLFALMAARHVWIRRKAL